MTKGKKVPGAGIAKVLLFYWVVLVAWQNIGGAQARSGVDMFLKVGLLGLMTVFYCLRAKHISRNILHIFLFAVCILLSLFFADEAISLSVLIGYVYPILQVFLVFGIGDDFQITKRELRFFLKGVIAVALYAAVYSVLFCKEEFQMALRMQEAYGNELSSFFISNHEYGMYLLFAIAACLICAETDKKKTVKTRLGYFLVEVFLAFNMVLTFSRTALFALVIMLVVYSVFNTRRRTRSRLLIAVVAGYLIVISSKTMQDTIELLLFKGKETGDFGVRDDLSAMAVELFWDSPLLNKIIGHGYSVRKVFENYSDHGSVHNAYLQVLLYFGVVGVLFMVFMLVSQFKANFSLRREGKFYSLMFSTMLLAGCFVMVTNTAIVFTSPIDSFFLTVVSIIVPKYVRNSIRAGTFED